MNDREGKRKLKHDIILTAVVLGVLMVITVVSVWFMAKTYTAHINLPGNEYSDIRLRQQGGEICSITIVRQQGRELVLKLDNGKPGRTSLAVDCIHKENSELTDMVSMEIFVSSGGQIFFGPDTDFNGHAVVPGSAAVFLLFLGVLMSIRYRDVRKESPFSYNGLVRLSLAIYFLFQGMLFGGLSMAGVLFSERLTSYTTFLIGGLIMSAAVLLLIPLIIIFAVFLTISNIALIRHERFRIANLLGFILSGLLLAGSGLIVLSIIITPGYLSVDPVGVTIEVVRAVAGPIFVYLFCTLIATEYLLFRVTRQEPAYDKDFIIILGCRIGSNGRLYPLIRGRADRALDFYKKQVEETGKNAILIPTGGQGSDEPMSEGEAVRNYLLMKGVSPEHIMAETKSTTTSENMRFAKEIIDKENKNAKVVFATNKYHVFRSGMIANREGIRAEGIGSNTKWYYSPNAQIREYIGLLANKWKVHLAICLLLACVALLMAYAPSLVRQIG